MYHLLVIQLAIQNQQGEILFEYIAMANRRRYYEVANILQPVLTALSDGCCADSVSGEK